jgi:hypothetical protein
VQDGGAGVLAVGSGRHVLDILNERSYYFN